MDDPGFGQKLVLDPYSVPLDALNPAQPGLFQADAIWPTFERLRREAPVHYTRHERVRTLLVDHQIPATSCRSRRTTEAFSSDVVCAAASYPPGPGLAGFRAAHVHRHGSAASTTTSARRSQPVIAPAPSLARLEVLIRERAARILDRLPVGEAFDWVETRLDRADHADAGDPVRFPAGRTAAS